MRIEQRGWPREDFESRIQPIIESMMLDRAWLVNCYAQIEYLLADMIVKCRKFREYADINDTPLPFGIDNRIKRARILISKEPLVRYVAELEPLFEHFLKLEETRHFFTHGFLSVHITKDGKNVGLHFRRYKPPKAGKRETRAELMVLPIDLKKARMRWTIFS